MGNYIYSLILFSSINFLFGVYTWRESKKTEYIKYFAGSLFCVGFWGIGLAGFSYLIVWSLTVLTEG